MTGKQFREIHGDPAAWTIADIEAQQNLAANDLQTVWDLLHPTPTVECWFCSAPNPATTSICGHCNNHRDDAPTHTPAA